MDPTRFVDVGPFPLCDVGPCRGQFSWTSSYRIFAPDPCEELPRQGGEGAKHGYQSRFGDHLADARSRRPRRPSKSQRGLRHHRRDGWPPCALKDLQPAGQTARSPVGGSQRPRKTAAGIPPMRAVDVERGDVPAPAVVLSRLQFPINLPWPSFPSDQLAVTVSVLVTAHKQPWCPR